MLTGPVETVRDVLPILSQRDTRTSLSGNSGSSSQFTRFRGFGLAIVFLLTGASTADTADPPRTAADSNQEEESIETLIRRLDSPQRSDRLTAESRLKQIGPTALPFVVEALPGASIQTQETLRRIRTDIELLLGRRALEASRISIVHPRKFREALHELQSQTGNSLFPEAVKSDFAPFAEFGPVENITFWSYLDRLEQSTGRSMIGIIEGPDSPLTKAFENQPLVSSEHAAFRTAVHAVSRKKLFGDPANDRLRIRLLLQAEPRLRPLFVRFRPAECEPQTDRKQRLRQLLPRDTVIELPATDNQHSFPVSLDLMIPTGTLARSFSLKGFFDIELAVRREPFAFAISDLVKSQQRRAGGVQIECRQLQNKPFSGMPTFQIRISYDRGGRAFESHRTWLYHNSVAILHPDGSRTRPELPFELRQNEDGSAQIRYRFMISQENLEESQFVYDAPTLISRKKVPFAFDGLPLPKQSGTNPSR